MAAPGQGGRNLDRGTRVILGELRDLRLEMRADRRHAGAERRRDERDRRQADEAWRQERLRVEEERRQADEAWREERRQADAAWQRERQQANDRFERLLGEFRQDSARRAAVTQRAFKDMRTVGLSIVKTLNHHTRLLDRIDRKLGAWRNGRPGQENSRGA